MSGYDLSQVGKNSRTVIFHVISIESEVKGFITLIEYLSKMSDMQLNFHVASQDPGNAVQGLLTGVLGCLTCN